ncbi:MAG: alkaline shock response membrane anchor protein AmaP [bacterium]|nr:alkaline shock response membrane anchor protein AmaP [bacterium]
MGIFDRVVLTLFTLSIAFLSALLLLVVLGWPVPLEILQANLSDLGGRWLLGVLAGVSLVVSVRFLYYGMRRPGERRSLIHHGPLGDTRISLGAVESLIGKVTRQVKGAREIKPRVSLAGDGVSVFLRAVVGPEVSVPEWSDDLQRTIKTHVRTVVGVDVHEVKIFVDNIASEPRRGRLD